MKLKAFSECVCMCVCPCARMVECVYIKRLHIALSLYLFPSVSLPLPLPLSTCSRNPDEVIRLIGANGKDGRGGVDKKMIKLAYHKRLTRRHCEETKSQTALGLLQC